MKYVTFEEAQNLYEANSIISTDGQAIWKDPIYGFNLIPSTDPQYPADEGWQEIIYYTSRRKDIFKYTQLPGNGFVYILSNLSMPGIIKIGYTSDRIGPEERAKVLSSSTAIPIPYKEEFAFRCFNGEVLEKMVHDRLTQFRVNSKREHFFISVEEAKNIIQELGKGFTNHVA